MKKLLFFFCTLFITTSHFSQSVSYGDNSSTGKYVQNAGAKIYYEVYGMGTPLLLLHGDALGYIVELEKYIPILSKHFKVIAVAKRGHGKSEIGPHPFTNKLFAEDALAVMKKENADSAIAVGFSGGGTTAYYLAANYPDKIKKVVALAGAINGSVFKPESLEWHKNATGASLEKALPDWVKMLKKHMPEPNRFGEMVEKMKNIWLEPVFVEKEKAAAINCPVLTVVGDRDEHHKLEHYLEIYQLIPHSQLAIIPDTGHVGLLMQPQMFETIILPFLLKDN